MPEGDGGMFFFPGGCSRRWSSWLCLGLYPGGMIVHITSREAWAQAQRAGQYVHASLERGGYIHCSLPTEDQLLAVADAHFLGEPDLVLLVMDPGRLTAEVRFEPYEEGSPLFPHVYGPVNLEAVVRVVDFSPGADGRFRLPERNVRA